MKFKPKTVGELPLELLQELVMEYSNFVEELADGEHEDRPVDIQSFLANDFLAYAEEKGFAWKLHNTTLEFTYKSVSPDHLDIESQGLVFQVRVPVDVIQSDDAAIREYIATYFGDTIFELMKAEQL